MAWFLNFVDLFIHPEVKKDETDVTRARALVLIALAYFVISIAMISSYNNPTWQNYLDPIIVTICLIISRLSPYTKIVSYIGILGFFAVNSHFAFNQNIYGAAFHWYSVIVMGGLFLGGMGLGVTTSVLSIIFIILVYIDKHGTSTDIKEFEHVVEVILTLTATIVFALIYEYSNTTLIRKISLAKKDLEDHKIKTLEGSRLSALGEMAGGIAHEINNPLAIIYGNADCIRSVIRHDNYSKDQVDTRLDKIMSTVERIKRVIRSMKLLSTSELGDENKPENLVEILADVCIFYQEKARSRGYKFIIDVPDLFYVTVNRSQIGQVFINLLNNAIDYLDSRRKDDSWIKIVASEEKKGFAYIFVSNSGEPITEEFSKKILNPFFTTKEVGKGTGLGLSISQSIAQANGGDLRVAHKMPTPTFLVILPLSKDSAKESKSAS